MFELMLSIMLSGSSIIDMESATGTTVVKLSVTRIDQLRHFLS